jgi:hypothetical protein
MSTDANDLKPATSNLLSHEESRLVYGNSLCKFHIYGATNGVRYDIVVHDKRVSWNVDSGKGWRAKGWACTKSSQAAAVAFAEGKLATLRDWASKQDVKPQARQLPWITRNDFSY